MTQTMPASVSMRLPEEWLELDPRADDLPAEFRRAVAHRWPDREMTGEFAQRVAAAAPPVLAEVLRLADRADVLVLGVFADALPVDGDDPLVLTANVTLAISPVMSDVAVSALARGLSVPGVDVRPVDLPAGHAVYFGCESAIQQPEWAEPVTALLRRYLIPIPALSRIAVLSCMTPNVELAEPFDAVFAAIAESIRFETD